MKSPISYLGGKSRLAKQIIEYIPAHEIYVEPFCGAAWVFFAKEPSKGEILNDANAELANFWRVICHHREELIDYLQYSVASRLIFDIQKQTDPSTLTDIQRAARFYSLQCMCFGGKTAGQSFGVSKSRAPRLSRRRVESDIEETYWRIANAHIENLDGLECVRRYDSPSTFFYIDPPYFGCENDYMVKWPRVRFTELAQLLSGIKGTFMLSLNDRKEVRDIFSEFQMKEVATKYSAGRAASSRTPSRGELLITNYELKR